LEQENDTSLIQQMATGDRNALATLYDQYGPLLLGVALKIMSHRAEAEDLVHDVFLEAWRSAADYDAQRGSVRCWLLIRLRSRALDRKGSGFAKRVSAVDDPRSLERPMILEEDPILSPDHHTLRRVLRELPPEQQQVLELAYFSGLSSSEIALRLEIPIGTVKSRTAMGLSRLRLALGGAV
jgi:RNA polymerase sigma-70 factor (ECF subfamily)